MPAARRLRSVGSHVCPPQQSPAGSWPPCPAAAAAASEPAREHDELGHQGHFDVLVVGAGFAGMYALRKYRDELGLAVKVLEQGGGVGGTWYWNAYPGAHCDVPVLEYSFGFDEALQRDYQG
jgi:hypothetical protein